jgi:preprotein translocase subunit SecE
MGILERAKQMADTGSFELPQNGKDKQQGKPKEPENKPKDDLGKDKEHKPNPVIKYFKEVRDELRKVEWPKRQEVIRGTIVVVVLSLGLAIILGASDEGFSYALQKALEFFNHTNF